MKTELIYYKDNNTIKDLIDRRMRNSLVSDTYSIMYSSASGARIKEATKIDGAIKALKLGAAQSLSVCYSVESRIRMSYRIEFDNGTKVTKLLYFSDFFLMKDFFRFYDKGFQLLF